MESKRKWILLAINFAVFLVVLNWLREHISLSELLVQFKSLPTEALVGALVLNVAVLGVYGVRLSLLLSARLRNALAVVIIGFGMNGILPFRMGEVAKLAYARQIFGIATSRLLAATAAEKILDLCALLLLGLLAGQLVVAPYLDHGIAIAGALVSILITGLVLAFLAVSLWERAGRKTHNWITNALDTLRAQRAPSRIIRLALLTTAIWAITIASVYWMFSSVLPHFSLSEACVLTLVLALAIAIPSAPAGLGIVEAAIVAYLHQALQIEPNQALASALAFHMIIVIPQVLATAAILLGTFFRRHGRKG
jgi:uncharacterized membrane protein YbhN (UPF0104 family)